MYKELKTSAKPQYLAIVPTEIGKKTPQLNHVYLATQKVVNDDGVAKAGRTGELGFGPDGVMTIPGSNHPDHKLIIARTNDFLERNKRLWKIVGPFAEYKDAIQARQEETPITAEIENQRLKGQIAKLKKQSEPQTVESLEAKLKKLKEAKTASSSKA